MQITDTKGDTSMGYSPKQAQTQAPTKTFKFTVNRKGEFVYCPSSDWAYTHTDRIRFQSEAGPFTIDFIPINMAPEVKYSPLSGPLTSVNVGTAVYAADTSVNDELDDAAREGIVEKNGFIGRYRYSIKVTIDGEVFTDDQKNGTYAC